MLPVAFTCPLWWVARWATRVLTSLAVVAALALGAGPATAATPTPGPVPTSSAVPASVAVGSLAACYRHCEAHSAARPGPAIPPEAAEEPVPTWSVDTLVALPGDQGTIAAGVLPVRAAESDRLSLVDAAGGRASRAPPGR
ncbi:hypothetical protein GAR05_02321 [Micromonospora saelicesensis]|uniref:Uncharacterized protein n=1 Tax=Micromonospora saelicesensis TaxID=285676 RepID=A0ABX9CLG9_9ACTN|nr:hypothetical protein [Micromonospora saelicesensis]RAO00351.1 hypothetical protein GAR05_02321 [Micromonospora saelicesensis]